MSAVEDAAVWIQNAVVAQSTREDDAGAAINAAIAQAHATLALVEQLRIANVIALGQYNPGDRDAYWRTIVANPTGELGLELHDDIREGLRLS